MDNETRKELDELRARVAALEEKFGGANPYSDTEPCHDTEPNRDAPEGGHLRDMSHMHPLPELQKIIKLDTDAANENGWSGAVSYVGTFESGGRQSNWVRHTVNADELLKFIENGTAEKVLGCIGNADRLNILLAILRKPSSVTDLIASCNLSSTGQAYHHLNQLIAADLVVEDEHGQKGTYIIEPHRVQGIIMLLAGICDMVDEQYTRGTWERE